MPNKQSTAQPPKVFTKDELLQIIAELKDSNPYDTEYLLRSNDQDTVHAAKSAELGRMGALQAVELIINLRS